MHNTLIILLLLLFSFQKDTRKAFHINGRAQGTTFHITYYADTERAKTFEIDSIFTEIDQSLSIYRENTLISNFNQGQLGVEMDAHLRKVVKKSLEIFKESGGIYDITIYPLVQLWGFGTEKVDAFPDSSAIRAGMLCVGSEKLRIKGNRLEKTSPCVKLNVNAIAPGYTADLIASLLEKKKIKTYVVEVGGELRIKGVKPDGQLISVGIESPRPNSTVDSGSVLQRIVKIKEGALTTSGNYRQFREQGERKVSHLLDARTGHPLQNELISVTVFAKDAMTADGFDNVLMGMGLEEAFSLLKKKKDMDAYFIYKKEDGSIADTATAGFYKILQ